MSLNNAKGKSFDYRNTKLFNEMKNEESNHNENEEISKLTKANDNLRKFLNKKDEKIKELENKIKDLEASKELKDTNKKENKEILDKKGEQGKLNSENKNNDINDNNKKEQDKKEVNGKLENKKDDIKEDNINITNDSYIREILKKVNEIYDYNVKIYDKLNKEKNQSNKVGEKDEKELGHQNGNNENKNNQNLNNIVDNSNNIITSSGDTPIDSHGNINQENKAGNKEIKNNTPDYETLSIYNGKSKEDKKTKMLCQTENAQNNNISQNNNQEGIQNNSNNNNINNVNNNMGETQSSNIDIKYQKRPLSRNVLEKNEKDIKTGKEKYINELKKIRENLSHITIYSDNYILEVLDNNNGDIEKSEKIIKENYKNYYQK